MKYFIYIFYITYFMLCVTSVSAINMESPLYKIQFGNVNIGAKNSSSGSYNINTTLGQTSAGEFSRNGYIISAGFQYVKAIIPFTFSISKNYIDLGTLVPNNFTNDTATLRVSFGAAGSYQVTAIEEGQLRTMDNSNTIVDTGCNGGNTCDETGADVWDSTSAYGFGYKMSGEDIPSTFNQPGCSNNCYRRFPDDLDLPTPEPPAILMSNNDVTLTLNSKPKDIYHEAVITFQANVEATQQAGTYQTIINFVATPGY